MSYSLATEEVQMLALNGLRTCLLLTRDDSKLFDFIVKKMYNEFAKHSKIGGSGFEVLNNLRVAQNSLIEVLRINTVQAYQIGFLYIRQLCLHLRNIRNNLSKEGLKTIYSWQYFNCTKLWVLALTEIRSQDLNLLVHPLVQLLTGMIKLSNNLKFFPFHLKVFHLFSII